MAVANIEACPLITENETSSHTERPGSLSTYQVVPNTILRRMASQGTIRSKNEQSQPTCHLIVFGTPGSPHNDPGGYSSP